MPSTVDAVWAVVAKATAQGELGTAAKVAPDEGDDRRPRVICIYTPDFTDLDDVTRVLRKMKDLGLVDTRGKPIYYKCGMGFPVSVSRILWYTEHHKLTPENTDAYTYLQLNSGNHYDIKASMYSSTDLLKAKPGEQMVAKSTRKRKATDHDDWEF
jgi:hypothetical protein